MITLHHTYSQIAAIISYKKNADLLRHQIENSLIDWEAIVKVASDHLVLTTVFCRLKSKSLIDIVPTDLKNYLEDLTHINRNRNESLLEEITLLSDILSKANISHVFLKGTALLASEYFQDFGERMIGDIDILVDPNDISKATQLIEQQHYATIPLQLSDQYQIKRHTPRLVNKQKMAAIELHNQLLRVGHHKILNPLTVLKNKRQINGFFVPSAQDLLIHNILDFQINDYGDFYNTIHLKHFYDYLIIMNKEKNIPLDYSTHFNKFYNYGSIYFEEIKRPKMNLKATILRKFFISKAKHPILNTWYYTFLKKMRYISVLCNRFLLFVSNNNYRADVFKLLKKT